MGEVGGFTAANIELEEDKRNEKKGTVDRIQAGGGHQGQ